MNRFLKPLVVTLLGSLLMTVSCLQGLYAQTSDGTAMALVGARLFDGTGSAPHEQSVLVIRNGRVEAVGALGDVDIPVDAERVDLSGKTILPGLVNAHGHLNEDQSERPIKTKLTEQLRVYADYGVTTVVVLGIPSDEELVVSASLNNEQEQIDLDHARIYVAGDSLVNIETEEEARMSVNAYADAGANIVKIHITGGPNDMTPAVYGALIDQAHSRGLRVAAHLFYLEDAHGLLDAGVDVIAHSVRDQAVDDLFIEKMLQQNVPYIPTLTRDLARFVYETRPEFLEDPFFLRRVGAYQGDIDIVTGADYQATSRSPQRQTDKAGLEQGSQNLKTLSDAGVVIAMGSDSGTNAGQWQGYFEHSELEMMVEAGMSTTQVLVAATGGAARAMGIDQSVGVLQPGRWADLLILDANPIENIRATRQIHSVWIAGNKLSDVP
jgi:imidazolonepropionase-like amidohydrolase